MMRLHFPAWLTLWLLAPVLGELISGSSPPKEYFQPVMFVMLSVLYGGGALLAREYTVLWRKDWRSLLLLGVAYGIAEEGLMCKSFFNPGWPDVGRLGEYGRWAGVNWVWAYYLTIYHALYSVGMSVMLAEVFHYHQRAEQWLKPWARRLLLVLFVLDIWLGYRFFPYKPSLLAVALTTVIIVLLIWTAMRLPARRDGETAGQASSLWKFGAYGFAVSLLFFVAMFAAPETGIPASMYLLLSALGTAVCGWLLWRMSGGGKRWSVRHRSALILGVLVTFALLDMALAVKPSPSVGDTSGMQVVALGAVALGVLAGWVARRAECIGHSIW